MEKNKQVFPNSGSAGTKSLIEGHIAVEIGLPATSTNPGSILKHWHQDRNIPSCSTKRRELRSGTDRSQMPLSLSEAADMRYIESVHR